MLKHVVMWKLEDKNKAEILQEMKRHLESLPKEIKEIRHFEVGLNVIQDEAAMDIVLYSEFDNEDDLRFYREHEAHQQVVQFIRRHSVEKRVVDYIL